MIPTTMITDFLLKEEKDTIDKLIKCYDAKKISIIHQKYEDAARLRDEEKTSVKNYLLKYLGMDDIPNDDITKQGLGIIASFYKIDYNRLHELYSNNYQMRHPESKSTLTDIIVHIRLTDILK